MLHMCNMWAEELLWHSNFNIRELALNVTFCVAEFDILNLQRGEWTPSSFTQFANSALPVVVRGSNNGVQMGKWVQWWDAQMSGTKRWGPQIVPPPPPTPSPTRPRNLRIGFEQSTVAKKLLSRREKYLMSVLSHSPSRILPHIVSLLLREGFCGIVCPDSTPFQILSIFSCQKQFAMLLIIFSKEI